MATELEINRRLTKAFIDTQPVTIALTPRTRVKKPAGGWAFEEQAPRAPQVLRLIEPSGFPRPTVTQDGVERVVDFVLLGEYDAVIGQYDVFSYQSAEWEVVQLVHHNGYETRAVVSRRG